MFNQEFWDQVEEEIKNGYINVQKHPTESLWIYNYTQNAMFDGRWNEQTINCRGLVVDENKKILSRCLPKFFTKEQCESSGFQIPNEEFEVFDKLDGSYIGQFNYNNKWFLHSRGSFISEQAIEALNIFNEKYSSIPFDTSLTYIYELISPENRIVVDYGNKRDLILLAIIDTKTGNELPVSLGTAIGLNIVTRYHGIKDFNKVLENFEKFKGTEFEGLVIRFKSGFRLKIKTEDYKRLHKILSGINEKRIWECISSGQGLQEILDVVDDAFYKWVKQVEHELMISYNATEGVARMMFNSAMEYVGQFVYPQDFTTGPKMRRKKFAEYVLKCQSPVIRSVCFQMYGNQSYKEIIWDSLEPKGNQKFKIVEEE